MKCLNCGVETSNPKFCSRSCAVSHSNSVCPKRIKAKYYCVHCRTELKRKAQFCSRKCQYQYAYEEQINTGMASFKVARRYKLEHSEYKCEKCNLVKWNEQPLNLHLDHVDGNRNNNKQENLKWLCPNCHSQTETWGIKNISDKARKKMHDGQNKGRKSRYNWTN